MKELILIRHAKSSWKHPELSDIDRPLNKRGQRDAPVMGEILAKKNVSPDLIISSPAERAKTTSITIAEIINYPVDKIKFVKSIYEASLFDLLTVIRNIDGNTESVMMFGHNPGFTMLNNYLTNRYIDNIPTCGIVSISFNSGWKDIEEGSGKLNYFIYPKLFINS